MSAIATAFPQETPGTASVQWRAVADQIRPKVPKLVANMDDAKTDVLTCAMSAGRAWWLGRRTA